ncbi:MAG: GNAT family N-acetyltransferase [Nanobdellota archaeon]
MATVISTGTFDDLKDTVKLDKVIFDKAKTPEQIKRKLSLFKNPHITLARVDEKLAGYGIGYEEKGKFYFWMLGVLPDYRKQGLGQQIIEEQMDYAKKSEYEVFFLKTSNRWKNMLRLTLKLGFDIVGFKINEWGSHSAIWLEKSLK